MVTAPALIIKALSVAVEEKTVVSQLDLTIKSGQIHCLMGPNGSGKTSLALALMGHPHYLVSSGDIRLFSESIVKKSPDERAHLGLFLAFQSPVAVPGISVQNTLKSAYEAIHCTGCTLHDHCPKLSVSQFRRQLTTDALKLGISSDLLARPYNEGFSGGEKKRLEMLTLLTLKPKIAILDETDSGLDVDSIHLIAKAINHAVKTQHLGVLLITHYHRLLEYVRPHQVSVMLHGSLVVTGSSKLIDQIETDGYKQFKNI